MKLLKAIGDVRFPQKDGDSWVSIPPSLLKTSHLIMKTRYHMKQLLACLLELKKRERGYYQDGERDLDASVCTVLSRNLEEYKTCAVKVSGDGIKLFVTLGDKDKKVKNTNRKR